MMIVALTLTLLRTVSSPMKVVLTKQKFSTICSEDTEGPQAMTHRLMSLCRYALSIFLNFNATSLVDTPQPALLCLAIEQEFLLILISSCNQLKTNWYGTRIDQSLTSCFVLETELVLMQRYLQRPIAYGQLPLTSGRRRDFKCKYGCLGFDPAGRMLYLGQRDGEDIWLGMLPQSFLDSYDDNLPAAYSSGYTCLTARHYRQLVMIIASVLHRMHNQAFYCHDIYEIDLDGALPYFEKFTDVM